MGENNLHNISKDQCVVLYKNILLNSDRKWEAGRMLSVIGEYGGAVSFLIISIEELVKAILIAMDGNGFHFRKMKGVDKFFRDHNIRYSIAFFMSALSVGLNELGSILKKIQKGEIDIQEFHRKHVVNKESFWEVHKEWILSKMYVFKNELKWFLEIDKLRQNGMYCDYKHDFICPQDIGREKYNEVYKKLKGVKKIGEGLIEMFEFNLSAYEHPDGSETTHSVVESLTKMKDAFNENEFYSKIGEFIYSFGTQKPLKILNEKFNVAELFEFINTEVK